MAKFLKGCTTIKELEDMPARAIHVIFKQYMETILDKDKNEAAKNDQAMDELNDALGG